MGAFFIPLTQTYHSSKNFRHSSISITLIKNVMYICKVIKNKKRKL